MSFYVTLPSDASLDMYPNNFGGAYKTKLASELALDSSYEVALVSLLYMSRDLPTVRDGENVIEFQCTSPAWTDVIRATYALKRRILSVRADFQAKWRRMVAAKENTVKIQARKAGQSPAVERILTLPAKPISLHKILLSIAGTCTALVDDGKPSGKVMVNLRKKRNKVPENAVNFALYKPVSVSGGLKFSLADGETIKLSLGEPLMALLGAGQAEYSISGAYNILFKAHQGMYMRHTEYVDMTRALARTLNMHRAKARTIDARVVIPPRTFTSVGELVTVIRETIQKEILEKLFGTGDRGFQLKLLPHDGHVWFSLEPMTTEGLNMWWRVSMSDALWQLLGFTPTQLYGGNSIESDSDTVNEDAGSLPTSIAQKLVSARRANLHASFEAFYVYTDIIEPQIVGHGYQKLLCCVPHRVENTPDDRGHTTATYEVVTPHYKKLSVNRIREIEINIFNSQGVKPLQFESNVITVLHFRKRYDAD